MMGFGLSNQEETHRREFESPPGYHNIDSNKSLTEGAFFYHVKDSIRTEEIPWS